MKVLPIYMERAIYAEDEKTLIIADLHLGIEFEYMLQGINIAVQTENLINRIKKLIEKKKAERLIILGDLKHIIVADKEIVKKERYEIRYFLKELSKIAEIWIIKGNHDGNIRSKYAKIFGSKGIKIEDIALVHGHAWPSPSLMDCEKIIMGHIHPNVRLQTKIGYSYIQPCWVRGNFKRKEFLRKYKEGNEKIEFIIMPAFNPLCGGIAVNKEEMVGALAKIMDIENAHVYLLNGLNLGKIKNLR